MIYQLLLSRDGSRFQIVPDPGASLTLNLRKVETASIMISDVYEELAERAGTALKALDSLHLSLDYRDPE